MASSLLFAANIRSSPLFQKLRFACAARYLINSRWATTATQTTQELTADEIDKIRIQKLRNIGISAHIDSGKTTLTERILYYTGRIKAIHEVRGKDNVGAKMDSMELEREKGITIQSAATYTQWDNHTINIIDTPGHVDFTIEVERALRVLDGAVLVLCGVSGVQSQTITVNRQMKRYDVPHISFVNKLDRAGANPFKIVDQLRTKLRKEAAAVQVPIGLENNLRGIVDLIEMRAMYYEGEKGDQIRYDTIPEDVMELAKEKRAEMIETLANVDDHIADLFLEEKAPTVEDIKNAIRRATVARAFTPVFMGSAYKNTGVQSLLDGVISFLPKPSDIGNIALDLNKDEEKIELECRSKAPLVALAFKLEEGRFGQLTYMRVYQGALRRGDVLMNTRSGKKIKVPRLVRMHSNEMEDVQEVGSGEICALFGVECYSGDTFTDGTINYSMTSMHVPSPVISLAITPNGKETANFSKALNRFQKEDPTFKVHIDPESKQTIISGMGELHLEIYVERMKREYGVDCTVGKPEVAYRETISSSAKFNYTHKKQSGGAGQYGRVIGSIEPIEEGSEVVNEFVNRVVGGTIPTQYIAACEKGFQDAIEKGPLIGHPVEGIRFILEDGLAHSVDSSELAFRLATFHAAREAIKNASAVIKEPIMNVSITAPVEYQGTVMGGINKRKGTIIDTEIQQDNFVVTAEVPLNAMFGYSTDLRSSTQGKGEFSMEYVKHASVLPFEQQDLIAQHKKKMEEKK